MMQTSVASERTRLQPETQEDDLLDPLLRLTGDMSHARALIVAEHGLDLVCGLIRLGCQAAAVLRPGGKPDASAYGLLLVPRVTALPSTDAVVRLARRSLTPNGRFIAGVPNGRNAAALTRRLRLNGFSTPASIHLPGLTLLCTDLRRPS